MLETKLKSEQKHFTEQDTTHKSFSPSKKEIPLSPSTTPTPSILQVSKPSCMFLTEMSHTPLQTPQKTKPDFLMFLSQFSESGKEFSHFNITPQKHLLRSNNTSQFTPTLTGTNIPIKHVNSNLSLAPTQGTHINSNSTKHTSSLSTIPSCFSVDPDCSKELAQQLLRKKRANTKVKPQPLGLKEISHKVKNIIKSSASTTYKEISDKIVKEIEQLDSQDSKNIRRRIYDALNVLKALGLFTNKPDEPKSIMWNPQVSKSEVSEDLKQQLVEQQAVVNGLKDKKNEAILKLQMFRDLISQNKIKESKIKIKEDFLKIKPPFLVIGYLKSFFHPNVIISEEQKKLIVSSTDPIEINGDLDVFKLNFLKNWKVKQN